MPALLPPPERDPDGSELMDSLRARIGPGKYHSVLSSARDAQYYDAVTEVNKLLENRRNSGGCSTRELEQLEAIARDLQSLARGF